MLLDTERIRVFVKRRGYGGCSCTISLGKSSLAPANRELAPSGRVQHSPKHRIAPPAGIYDATTAPMLLVRLKRSATEAGGSLGAKAWQRSRRRRRNKMQLATHSAAKHWFIDRRMEEKKSTEAAPESNNGGPYAKETANPVGPQCGPKPPHTSIP